MNYRYFTTTLPYVNSDPHIGHALEFVQADCVARHFRLKKDSVFFNVGTDEHGLKIYRKALENNLDPQEYVDDYAKRFEVFYNKFFISYDAFVRTTSDVHKKSAQAFWKRCADNGDIYKASYKVKYCVGCELEKTDSELVDEKCPVHPNLAMEQIEEENYFFRFSNYQDRLLALYEKHADFVVPKTKLNEISEFVKRGLSDFSISRIKDKMPHGVPVPSDDTQVMYVWFDALVGYITSLGWDKGTEEFGDFWGSVESPVAMQFAGKDNLRQQSAMWQAMLMSAGLPTSRNIFIHGYVTADGEKMSKSLGNVVDPMTLIKDYGVDAVRFWLLHDLSTHDDGDFNLDKFKNSINGNLSNGIGNLASRVYTMAQKYGVEFIKPEVVYENKLLDTYDVQEGLKYVLKLASNIDKEIADKQPFKLYKEDPVKAKEIVNKLLKDLYIVAYHLEPFLPSTSSKILDLLEGKVQGNLVLPLFPKVE